MARHPSVPSPLEWSPEPAVANGKQFIRYRVTFNIQARIQDLLNADSRRPVVRELTIRSDF